MVQQKKFTLGSTCEGLRRAEKLKRKQWNSLGISSIWTVLMPKKLEGQREKLCQPSTAPTDCLQKPLVKGSGKCISQGGVESESGSHGRMTEDNSHLCFLASIFFLPLLFNYHSKTTSYFYLMSGNYFSYANFLS